MEPGLINSFEYTVEKKMEGVYCVKRVLYVTASVFATIALCTGCVISKLLLYFTPVMFMLCIILFKYLYMYLQIEYKYILDHGVLTVYRVYGGKKQKVYYTADVKEASSIRPADRDAQRGAAQIFDSCISRAKPTPELYVMDFVYGGKKTTAYFESTKQMLRMMKYYNKSVVISEYIRH